MVALRLPAHSEIPFRSQAVDVRDDVPGRLLVVHGPAERRHLRSVEALWMPAPVAGPEIVELAREVPVAHARETRRIRRPHTLPVLAVAVRAGHVQLPSVVGVT